VSTDTIQQRVLRNLSTEEGESVMGMAMVAGITVEQASAALQRLKRHGLASCGHGHMGWSWFAVIQTGGETQ
jgi:CRP-like cAMP-binding protein